MVDQKQPTSKSSETIAKLKDRAAKELSEEELQQVAGGEKGKVQMQDLSFVKKVDVASPR
ncbi:bacteriocin [Labrys wisconsinensis]|uniref:Bacteriocin-like protein n=1 Tax=Labrys wisconsinensis TaxID=425677 RepID=A0ABU0JBD9_9HYPH|nr:bacteriocin [Labrys wisconsinensis]MDQ0471597.1 bacteriocin-like protein [Labrys wisconsinensis]